MFSLIIGICFIFFTVFAVLPPEVVGFGLDWGQDILMVLRGGLPVLAAFIGLLSIFIGIADIKDKSNSKKEGKCIDLSDKEE